MNVKNAQQILRQLLEVEFNEFAGASSIISVLQEEYECIQDSNLSIGDQLRRYGLVNPGKHINNLRAALMKLQEYDCNLTKLSTFAKTGLGNCAVTIDAIIHQIDCLEEVRIKDIMSTTPGGKSALDIAENSDFRGSSEEMEEISSESIDTIIDLEDTRDLFEEVRGFLVGICNNLGITVNLHNLAA